MNMGKVENILLIISPVVSAHKIVRFTYTNFQDPKHPLSNFRTNLSFLSDLRLCLHEIFDQPESC